MIKKIILKLGGKEVGVTVKEARKLYEDLGEIFYQPYINSPIFTDTWTTHTPLPAGSGVITVDWGGRSGYTSVESN